MSKHLIAVLAVLLTISAIAFTQQPIVIQDTAGHNAAVSAGGVGVNVLSPADAGIGASPTTTPAQTGGLYESSRTVVGDGKVAAFHFAPDQTLLVSPPTASYTDRSGTLSVGGTSQTLMSANTARKGYFIQNPCSQVESIFVNFTSAASLTVGSIEVIPCNFLSSAQLGPTTEAITWNAATGAHPVVAKEQQ